MLRGIYISMENVWNKIAYKYDRLWVQKYSLKPTRNRVIEIVKSHFREGEFTLLDLGCGTGQLVSELSSLYTDSKFFSIDKSNEMISYASKNNIGEYICCNIDDCDLAKYIPKQSIDIIVCCHSFPYYTKKSLVLSKLKEVLKPNGIIIFVQASINNLYDKGVMSIIEKTAEKAEYLSRENFRKLVEQEYKIEKEFKIKERFFMPSICGFVLVNQI